MVKISLFIGLALVGLRAQADQCAWMDGSDGKSGQNYVVKSAKKLLDRDSEYINYCAPCGNGGPSKIIKAENVAIGFAKMGNATYDGTNGEAAFRKVSIQGEDVDLAYIYVRTGSRVFTNLALLVGCPAKEVPPALYTAPGKSASPVSWEEFQGGRRPASASPAKK